LADSRVEVEFDVEADTRRNMAYTEVEFDVEADTHRNMAYTEVEELDLKYEYFKLKMIQTAKLSWLHILKLRIWA
jgi:hypothetical protein